MLKKLFFFLSLAAAIFLAACTTQPAMSPSHIALLHSGEMIVAIPKRPYLTLLSPYKVPASEALIEGLGVSMGGAIGGAIYGAAGAAHKQGAMAANMALAPYADLIHEADSKRAFLGVAKSAASHVSWMGGNPEVKIYPVAGVPGSGKMSHLAQTGKKQAVVLVKCVLGFSADLRSLVAVAEVQVYARGRNRAQLIDGGSLEAGAQLQELGPALKAYGFEGIATGKLNDRAALGARANVWFEKGGERYKAAVTRDMASLRLELSDYLNGRRGSK